MTKAKMCAQAPVLLVSDIPASIAYWQTSLGFASQTFGDPPEFAIGRRDNCFVMLAKAPAAHEIIPLWRIRDKTWNAYFWVDDAKALYQEYQAAGARIDYSLYEAPYGVLEFGIQDLDGHDIAFGQDLQ